MDVRQEHILATIILSFLLIVTVYAAVDYDVNNDNQITIEDLKIIFRNFGKTQNFEQEADVNKDGRVNLFDLVRVTRHYGKIITVNTTNNSTNATSPQPCNSVITGITLVNALTDLDIRLLNSADTVDLTLNPSISLRANVLPAPGSVKFVLNGPSPHTQTESTEPYAIKGDDPRWNYNPWTPATGDYTLTVNVYSQSGGAGSVCHSMNYDLKIMQSTPPAPLPQPNPSPNLGFLPSFPGAEGFGAVSKGGRGGRAIEVTNLNDAGTGSLRACIEATGPRTCVFKVGGTITTAGLKVTNPFLTIAGQTAPGGGILLKSADTNGGPTFHIIDTSEVTIRHIRIRTGGGTVPSCCRDALELVRSQRVIIDHVSVSWGVDGNIDLVGARDVTVQWSTMTEALYNSTHEKGPHSMGNLISAQNFKGVSVHHNFYAHNNERNPRVHSLGPDSTLDFVNNVIYDPGGYGTVITTNNSPVPRFNYVKNYIKEGPDTLGIKLVTPIAMSTDSFPPIRLYLSGNYMYNRDADVNNVVNGFLRSGDRNKGNLVTTRFPAPPVTEYPATDLLTKVLPYVGATKPVRDSVDTRLVNEAINCQGLGNCPGLGIIDHPDEVGGWPNIAGGTPYTDSDKDGMSDSWETQNGLNPNSPVTVARPLGTGDGIDDKDGDGYTNLEEFLNELADGGQQVPSQPVNNMPSVNAGPDKTITLPNTASLQGTVSDDGLPSPPALAITWTKISGPGTVSFSNANSATTTATFSAAGTYVLRLTGSDGVLSSSDQITIQVNSLQTNLGFLPSFPGAEGFGAVSKGGRGGRVIEVTNLNDAGIGSLRACIEATGPRTCIFKVGGTIVVKTKLVITNHFVTIVGQTAPGGGILLRNDPSNKYRTISVGANDVIIRHIRLRPGPSTEPSCCLDAINIYQSKNVILDHVSASWSTDGNVDIGISENVTVQYSIISEGLKVPSHEEGSHSTGHLISEGPSKGISIHHNFLAHNNERNPRVHSLGPESTLDFVNNVIYDPGGTLTVISTDNYPVPRFNYVKNYVKEGPDTLGIKLVTPIAMSTDTYPPIRLFLSGNYMYNRDADVNNVPNGFLRSGDRNKGNLVTTRFPAPPVTEYLAKDLPASILQNVGATKPKRDIVDARIVDEFFTTSGFIPDIPEDVGGWPVIAGGTPYTDSDKDGMSDSWEIQNGLNPNSPVTASRPLGTGDGIDDKDGDGYTNLEEFLNELADGGQQAPSQPVNNMPSVNAGQDETITLPSSANLIGTVNDDSLPNPPGSLAITWTKISGPGTVSFSNVNSATTTATFSAAGAYVLRITASDSALSASDDVTVTVNTGSQNVDLTSGLVLHLKFDENSGAVASDSSGNNLQGTVNGASWAQGKVNGALSFDGSDDYVEMIDSALFNIGSKSTFAAWIFIKEWPVSSDSWIHTIFSDEKYPPTAIWRLGSKGLESLKQRIGINFNNGADKDIENNNDLQLNTWHHIAVVTDSANVLFYVDGSLDTTKPYSVTPTQKSNKWRVGESETYARNFNGTIDDVRLYNRPLSPQEVLAVFNG